MARNPDERPLSAPAAAAMIAPSRATRRRRWIAAGVGIAAVAAAATWWRPAPAHEAMGLPDAVALADLAAAVRAFDIGEHAAALAHLDRAGARAPDSAALRFWRATVLDDAGDEAARREACAVRPSADDDAGAGWRGGAPWLELAASACATRYGLGDAGDGLLTWAVDGPAWRRAPLPAALLPLAVKVVAIDRIEGARAQDSAPARLGAALVSALARPPTWELPVALPVRWSLARAELALALGDLAAARASLASALEREPDAPILRERAAALAALAGDRAHAPAEPDSRASSPSPAQLTAWLEAGQLERAWAAIAALEAEGAPTAAAARAQWCGFAYRFEVARPPDVCRELGPGLVRALWGVSPNDEADRVAMTALEQWIVRTQAALNRGECPAPEHGAPIVGHAPSPFATYLAQLDIGAALCAADPEQAAVDRAKAIVARLVAATPDDPWALLLEAQVDEASGQPQLARAKQLAVADRWRDADELPLVVRLRRKLGVESRPLRLRAPVDPGPGAP